MRIWSQAVIFFSVAFVSGCVTSHQEMTPLAYELVTADDPENAVFIVSLKSEENSQAICIYIDHWPTQSGSAKLVDDRVKIVHQDGIVSVAPPVYARDCPGGCGRIRIKPNEEIKAVIPYSEFGDAKEIAALQNKRLEYSLTPYRCK
jgi:hypothetical protein